MGIATVTAVSFINRDTHSRMQQTIQLTSPSMGVKVPTMRSLMKRIVRFLFSPKASLIAACIVAALMYFHFMTIADTPAAQRAIAIDCLLGTPWGIAYLIRSIRKGGKK